MKSLKVRAIQGSMWVLLGFGGNQVLRLGSNLVLAWLLFPEAFGLMALVYVFMGGLRMFSDVGIRGSILYHRRGDDPEFLNTAWTVQIIRGFVLWIFSCLLAIPVMKLYGEPMLGQLLPVAGLTAIIAGFNSTAIYTLNRQVALGRIALLDVISQTVGIVVMISWALLQPTVWALIAGALTGAAVKMVLSHAILANYRNHLHWDVATIKSLFRFGKWIFLSTIATYLSTNIDRLLLGTLVPLALLGVYQIAWIFAMLPSRIGGKLAQAVLHPALAECGRQDPLAFASRFQKARQPILSIGLVASLAVALLAPAFFGYLYDERYADARWIAQLLSIAVWFTFLQTSADRALLALGDSRSSAMANACKCIGTAAGSVLGFWLADVRGLVLGIAVGNMVGQVAVQWLLARHAIYIFWTDVIYTTLFGGLFLLGVVAPKIVSSVVKSIPTEFVQLMISVLVLTVVGILVGWSIFTRIWSVRPDGVSQPVSAESV